MSALRLRLASVDGMAIGKAGRRRKPPAGSYAAAAIEAQEAVRAYYTLFGMQPEREQLRERMERLDAELLGYPIVTIEDAIVAMDVAGRFYGTEQTRQALAGAKLVLRNLARRRRR